MGLVRALNPRLRHPNDDRGVTCLVEMYESLNSQKVMATRGPRRHRCQWSGYAVMQHALIVGTFADSRGSTQWLRHGHVEVVALATSKLTIQDIRGVKLSSQPGFRLNASATLLQQPELTSAESMDIYALVSPMVTDEISPCRRIPKKSVQVRIKQGADAIS